MRMESKYCKNAISVAVHLFDRSKRFFYNNCSNQQMVVGHTNNSKADSGYSAKPLVLFIHFLFVSMAIFQYALFLFMENLPCAHSHGRRF